MAEPEIRFQNGVTYEKMMGVWSRLAGDVFLDWLQPAAGMSWIDVGCGNGAFTETIVERCSPSSVEGIDPSEEQLSFARQRHTAGLAHFQRGDAMALPFPDDAFGAAAMALVIFFVPDPAKGVAEMARVVRPGGSVSAYGWDFEHGGFPLDPVHAEMRKMGIRQGMPPHPEVVELDNLQQLWSAAGLAAVETRVINVERAFANFDDYWDTALLSPGIAPQLAGLSASDLDRLKAAVRQRVPAETSGRVVHAARAHAVKGMMPH